MDPLKRLIFPTAVYLHSGEISPVWDQMRCHAARIIAKAYDPLGFWDSTTGVAATLLAPDLWVRFRTGGSAGLWVFICWCWSYRRFVWQRVKEKIGLVRGRSRWDDDCDWARPAFGPLNPIWSLRLALLRVIGAKRSRRASTGVHRGDTDTR
jgi:hypothetical protein